MVHARALGFSAAVFVVLACASGACSDSGGSDSSSGTGGDAAAGDGALADGSADGSFVAPTDHPFIQLTDFDAVDHTSDAFTRLQAEVDDVVTVTAGLAPTDTYDTLVSKLSSDHYGYSCTDSIVMYHLTGDAKYLTQAITMVDLYVKSENALIASGSTPVIANDSYLDIGEYMEQLALTYDYGYKTLTPQQRTDWEAFANTAIQNLWNNDTAKWGAVDGAWDGWATSDPGDNYYYSFLKATELWALADQSSTWEDFLHTKKFPLLETYFTSLPGGGTREGTGYGTSLMGLFSDFRYWKSSTGEDISKTSTNAANTIQYWLHATVPTHEYYASIGDQARSSMTTMFDYQRVLMLEAVNLNKGSPQGALGAWWLNHTPVTDGGSGWVTGKTRYNYDYRFDLLASAQTEQAPTDLVYDADGVGALFARSSWDDTASWMSTVAGIYDQSHAHQEQGAFEFFKGTWLSATTNLLSKSGLHQETGAQNVIRFEQGGNVIPQNHGTATMTFTDSADSLVVQQTLTPVYSDNATAVTSWTRTLTYTRSAHTLQVHDMCAVAGNVTPIFQVQLPITTAPTVAGSVVTAGSLSITQTTPAVSGANAPKVVHMPSVDSDFNDGYRVELTGSGCEFVVTLQAN